MPIPHFNHYGVLPPGLHRASLEELNQRLGFSPRRQELIRVGLRYVCGELKSLGIPELFLDGSFATVKPSPADIDGYVIAKLGSDVATAVQDRRRRWSARHQVDLFVAFEDVAGHGSVAYWEDFFGHTREQPPQAKGLVKLILGR